eukprot:scaffold152735_cov51-Prasinocladus_malaysianus.AAC.1
MQYLTEVPTKIMVRIQDQLSDPSSRTGSVSKFLILKFLKLHYLRLASVHGHYDIWDICIIAAQHNCTNSAQYADFKATPANGPCFKCHPGDT